MAGMLSRHGQPLTVAVLKDELNNLREDMSRETQRLLAEHRERLGDQTPRSVPPRPDLAEKQSASWSRPLGATMSPTISKTLTQRAKRASNRRSKAEVPRGLEAETTSEDEYEDKEPHPFLKRNPRVNGGTKSRFETVSSGRRSTDSAAVQDYRGMSRFQLLPEFDQTSQVPETESEPGHHRELRLSAAEGPSRPFWPAGGAQDLQWREWARSIVHSKVFEHLVCVMVFFNAVILGIETENQWTKLRATYTAGDLALCFPIQVIEVIFCVVFASELVLRIVVDRWDFFCGHEWAWNLYDLIAIGLQIVEQATNLSAFLRIGWTTSVGSSELVKDLNILRIARITRLVRIVRLLEELRMIVASITSSLCSLGWTFLLLMMLLYSLALFFTEVVLQNVLQSHHQEEMQYWFGGLGRTFLTMFECIFGGVSWDEVLNPLILDISPAVGWVFCIYISFCLLAMMNMATGVFVDNAMRKAQEDKDTQTAQRISDLFFNDPVLGEAESITLEQFCSKIDTPEMQDYFKAINVDPSEAQGLYRLLDADDSGSIDAIEMVAGCLRLRGGAKALELSLLQHEVSRMNQRTSSFQVRVEKNLAWLMDVMEQDPAASQSPRASRQSVDPTPPFMPGSSAMSFSESPKLPEGLEIKNF